MKKYLLNCFLLTLPVMLWNILLTDKLPAVYQSEVFWHNIPDLIVYGENILRGLVFLLAFLMPLPTYKLHQKTGFWLYLTGLALYFASWILLIEHPDTQWSKSLWGFAAPAYTPILWLTGIALLGERWTRYYIIISVLFVVFHCWHCWVVWGRF